MRKAIAHKLRHSWDSMVAYEEELCAEVFDAPDAKEGVQAFCRNASHAFKISDGHRGCSARHRLPALARATRLAHCHGL